MAPEHFESTMEKPNWLWKEKSSERSSGESETSESVSSQSERVSDGQSENTKDSPDDDIQSPEVSSKMEPENEEVNDSIRALTEKLSAALVNVSAKDDLVKQHAKVAEEAVAGWEKAENEVVELKQKLEATANKKSALEDRVNHLDGALKECVRQLRQARDEQEQKIQEAVAEKTHEFESAKSGLENQIIELQNQLEAAKYEDLSRMVESLARDNLVLKHELLAQREELEVRMIERDLSTQAAETASKQHLDSIKKVAKLEAECRKLRLLSKSPSSDHRSTDSQSDGGERIEASCSDSWASALIAELDQFKSQKSVNKGLQNTSSVEIDLMGDFLEMERLVALPETEDESHKNESELAAKEAVDAENSLRSQIEVLTCRTKELEEKLEKIEAEKAELEGEVQHSKEVENTLRFELEAVACDKMELEEKLGKMEAEKAELEEVLEKMEAEKAELKISCDIWREKHEGSQVHLQEVEKRLGKVEAEKAELEISCDIQREKHEESQIRLQEVEKKLEKMAAEKAELEISCDIRREKHKDSQVRLQEVEMKLEEIQKELNLANESKTEVESQLIRIEAEALKKCAKIESLEGDVTKERARSVELMNNCQELAEELSREREQNVINREKTEAETKIKQEDIDTAAGKLAECQKTIASLGKQLQSLATLEDFLIDTAGIPGFSGTATSNCRSSVEKWKLHVNETFSGRNPIEPMKLANESSPSVIKNNNNNNGGNSPPSLSSAQASSVVSSNQRSSEKNRNGFAKFFTRSKNGIHLEIM